jgi:hypothetical protein
MSKSLTSEIIKLKNARGSFLRLWVPKAFQEGQTPRYEGTFLLDPSNAEHAAVITQIKSEATKLVKAKWGEKPPGLKLCFGLADSDETKAKYDGYAGMFYITTANTTKPTVVNGARQEVAEGARGAPYSGCYVNTNITLWTQDNKFGKAIRGNLRIVQFAKDGPAFSGSAAPRAEDEFEAIGDQPGAATSITDDDFDL